MKNRIVALLLCLSMMLPMFVGSVVAEEGNYGANVGRYAVLAESGYGIQAGNFTDISEGNDMYFGYEEFESGTIFKITDWYLDTESQSLWYAVEIYAGGVLPELQEYWPAMPWVMQDYVGEGAMGDSLVFLDGCDICGKPDCGGHESVGDSTKVMIDGVEVRELTMPQFDKPTLSATTTLPGEVTYRWQILADRETELWVNIYGEDRPELTLSYGMVASLLDSNHQVQVRCVSAVGDTKCVSEALTITLEPYVRPTAPEAEDLAEPIEETIESTEEIIEPIEEPIETAEEAIETAEEIIESTEEIIESTEEIIEAVEEITETAEAIDQLPEVQYTLRRATTLAEGSDEELHMYDILVYYVFEGTDIAAAPSYTASMGHGKPFVETVTFPTVVGYEPIVNINGSWVQQESYTFDIPSITEDVVLEVRYQPALVTYRVYVHLQNVYDDGYPDSAIVDSGMAYTGSTDYEFDQQNTKYPGFYQLPYDKPPIAADGSTTVEIYFDRLYFLMTFDLGGGYGVEPIYARYGTELTEISNPVRPGFNFLGWDKLDENNVGDGIPDTLPDEMPAYSSAYRALWEALDTTYSVAYWVENSDGTRTYLGTKVEYAKSNDTVSGTDDFSVSSVCGMPQHTHTASCYACGLNSHLTQIDQGELNCGHVHNAGCCTGYTQQNPNANYLAAIEDIGDGEPESGYVYTINNNRYYLYVDGTWYYQRNNNSWVTGEVLGTGQYRNGYTNYTAQKYNVRLNCGHVHSEDCTHNASCYKCKLEAHSHTQDCKSDMGKYVEFVSADQDVIVKGDGSTVVNAYYKKKLFEIRYVFARRSGNQYQIASLTNNGVLGNWQLQNANALPTLKANSRFTVKEEVIGDYTYYYIAVRAEYGANIESLWPGNEINDVRAGNNNYRFGSWAAENDTPYRANDPDHANIVGPYPYMSAEMIKVGNENTSYYDPETQETYYIAQRMSAWWGTVSGAGISNHVYHIYYESLDGTGDRQYNGKWYKLVDSHEFNCAHNGSTRVDPFYYNGFECINDTRGENNSNLNSGTDYQKNSQNYAKGQTHYNCPNNTCAYCNCFYYDRVKYTLSYVNYNVSSQAPNDEILPYGKSLTDPGIPAYPTNMELDAYTFDGWYTTAEFHSGTEVNWKTITMPDSDLTLYAKWKPVVHHVRIFLTENLAEEGEVQIRDYDIPHGELVPEDQRPETPINGNYEFIGWFYRDDQGREVAFDFNNMPIKDGMSLYAKWSSKIPVNYTVRFLKIDTVEPVAPEETGSGLAGYNKTFYAADGIEGWFPLVKSTGLTLDLEESKNVCTFYYVEKEAVPYTVRYVTIIDGQEVDLSEVEGIVNAPVTKNVANNRKAVVTENFVPVPGYLPDASQKFIVVSADGKDNVITFVYTKDELNAYYIVSDWIQDIDGVTWIRRIREEGSNRIGTEYTRDSITIPGFTYDEDNVNNLSHGTLVKDRILELNFYYTRNKYPYQIRYLEFGTEKELADPVTYTGDNMAYYGASVNAEGKPIADVDGYQLHSVVGCTIGAETNVDALHQNVVKVYYVLKTGDLLVTKVVNSRDSAPDDRDFQFSVTVPDGISGSYAVTIGGNPQMISVTDGKLKFLLKDGESALIEDLPQGPSDSKYEYTVTEENVPEIYYAVGNNCIVTLADETTEVTITNQYKLRLTIEKSNAEDDQVFVYEVKDSKGNIITVTVVGNGSTTIHDLVPGDYTVTQKNLWSWRYGDKDETKSVTLTNKDDKVDFGSGVSDDNWLDGNSQLVVNRKGAGA